MRSIPLASLAFISPQEPGFEHCICGAIQSCSHNTQRRSSPIRYGSSRTGELGGLLFCAERKFGIDMSHDDWEHFLSDARVGTRKPVSPSTTATNESGRSEFHKDYDRIIFSSAFRKLADKTQVVPLPQSTYTRQRLTHSLEVSCVGRSLATLVYNSLGNKISRIRPQGDFEAIVAAACLAHDIGNPPFGHFGEKAIQDWATKARSGTQLQELTDAEFSDIARFEGNAQTFRILTRLQMGRPGGMRLTAATLGAVIKYPTYSRLAKTERYKKHGCVIDDADCFEQTFQLVNRPADPNGEYARHPLALLSEAADDICYAIIDLEDGCKSGLIVPEEAYEILDQFQTPYPSSSEKDKPMIDRISLRRATSIGVLVEQCVGVFLDNITAIVSGSFVGSLIDHCESHDAYQAATSITRERVFHNERVLAMEAAGYSAIQGLLDILLSAAFSDEKRGYDVHVRRLTGVTLEPSMTSYQRILACTDYVSGMTDRYCLELFETLTGHGVGSW